MTLSGLLNWVDVMLGMLVFLAATVAALTLFGACVVYVAGLLLPLRHHRRR